MTIEIINNKQIEEVIGNGKNTISNDMNNKRNIMKNIVKKICDKDEKLLEDDLKLYIEYLRVCGLVNVEDDGKIIKIIFNKKDIEEGKIIKPESISRCRRELHKEGELIYDEDTEQKREKFAKEFKEYFKKDIYESENYDKKRMEWMQ